MRRLRPLAIAAVVVTAAVIALGAVPAAAAPARAPFPTSGTADYQLGGGYRVPAGTTIVARDSTSRPAPGVYSICYVNGFQTQPQDRDRWLSSSRRSLLLRDADGDAVIDPNWPDEFMLDTSTAAKRTRIATIVGRTIARCAAAGFDAVEIDNLDSFTRSDGLLTASDNRRLAHLLAVRAHRLGLSIGQKNTGEYAASWRTRVGFDFAVAEECHRYDECALYTRAYGARVIDIEYTDDLRGTFADVCAAVGRPRFTVLRDRDLVPPARAGYAYATC